MQLWPALVVPSTQRRLVGPQLVVESLEPDAKQLHGHWLAV